MLKDEKIVLTILPIILNISRVKRKIEGSEKDTIDIAKDWINEYGIGFLSEIFSEDWIKIVNEAESILGYDVNEKLKDDIFNLHPIFQYFMNEKDENLFYYDIGILGEKCFFPIKGLPDKRKSIEKINENICNFAKKLSSLKLDNFYDIDILLNLSRRYLFFIPLFNYTSVYHFSKLTSAISICIREYMKNNKDILPGRDEKIFLILKGDISGIQNFIYSVTMKRALKNLRGRSFFLQLLIRHYINSVLEKNSLPRNLVIFEGGGGFIMILPNTNETINKIEEINKNINDYLFENFRGRIFLNIGFKNVSSAEIMNQNEDLIYVKKIEENKLKKFVDSLSQDKFEPYELKNICSICGLPNPEDVWKEPEDEIEIPVCKHCNSFYEFGSALPESKYIIITDREDKKGLKIEDKIYICANEIEGNSNYIIINPKEDETYKEGILLSRFPEVGEKDLQKLVEKSKGAEYLGVLRLDVDNLGFLLLKGIQKEKDNLLRFSIVSDLLNLFFTHFIDKIASGELKNDLLKELFNNGNYNIVVVYSGGDDLFIVGPWNEVIKFAFDVNFFFKKFVCENEKITISGGIVITHKKFPIYSSANISGEAEELAKSLDSIKNKISLIYTPLYETLDDETKNIFYIHQTFQWEDWEKLFKNIFIPLYKLFKDKYISRGFIYDMWNLSYKYIINPDFRNQKELLKPNLAYRFARNIKYDKNNTENLKLIEDLLNLFVYENDTKKVIERLLSSRKLFEILLLLTKN